MITVKVGDKVRRAKSCQAISQYIPDNSDVVGVIEEIDYHDPEAICVNWGTHTEAYVNDFFHRTNWWCFPNEIEPAFVEEPTQLDDSELNEFLAAMSCE